MMKHSAPITRRHRLLKEAPAGSRRRRLRGRAAAEEGFVMAASISILLVLVTIATAVVLGAVPSTHLAMRATSDSMALQAAESAADLGWNRVNTMQQDSMGLSGSTPCLQWSGSTVTAVAATTYGSTQWCPAVSVSVPGASSASYQMSVLSGTTRYIIGSGTVNGVTRRMKLTLKQTSLGTSLFGSYAVQSEQALDFQNGSLISGGGVISDYGIKLEDTVVSCHVPNGSVTPGPGYTVTTTNGAGTCGQSTASAGSKLSWQTISPPSSDNDSRICVSGQDTCSGGTITWTSSTKSLTIQNNGTVTLTGNTYTFCVFNDQNGTLDVKPSNGQAVQIYMLPPSSCSAAGVSNGSQTFTLQNNNSWIKNDTGLGAKGVQVYFVGPTLGYLNNSSSYQFNGTIYAPSNTSTYTSTPALQVINSAAVVGALAAWNFSWTANASMTYDSSASSVTGGSGGYLYNQNAYSECGATGSAPDTNCP